MALTGAGLADPELMLSRLERGCIALTFTACVLAVARSHRLADTVKGVELSYTALAMEREQIAWSSLLALAGAALAGPEPMPSRLVRGCIALAITPCALAAAWVWMAQVHGTWQKTALQTDSHRVGPLRVA